MTTSRSSVVAPEDVREALASIDTMVAAEQLLLQPFRRTTTIVGTAASIRATLRELKRVGERLNNHVHRDNVSRSQLLGERVRESKGAFEDGLDNGR